MAANANLLRNNGLTRGLVFAMNPNRPGSLVRSFAPIFNDVDGRPSSSNIGVTGIDSRLQGLDATTFGQIVTRPALTLSTTAITTQFNSTFGLGAASATILCGVYDDAAGGFNHGCLVKVGDVNTGYGIGVGTNASIATFDSNGNSTAAVIALFEAVRWIAPGDSSTVYPGNGCYLQAGLLIRASVPTIIMNGRLAFTSSGTNAIAPAGNVTYFGGYVANRYPLANRLDYVYIWNRALLSLEMKQIYADPLRIYSERATKRVHYATAAAAAAGHPYPYYEMQRRQAA